MTEIAPAQLFITSLAQAQDIVYNYLQAFFCPQNKCGACTTCQLIKDKQHHSVLWIEPEKRYTLDLLEPIVKKTELSLEPDQKYFFILTKADFLTPSCANSLLKIVEEPPPGYHFIFTTQNKQLVLPTIRSRCVIQTYTDQSLTHEAPALGTHFMSFTCDPHAFLKALNDTQITELESKEIIDFLLDYWCTHYKKVLASGDSATLSRTQNMITLFETALHTPAMPGSTKIFWRNLFLHKSVL